MGTTILGHRRHRSNGRGRVLDLEPYQRIQSNVILRTDKNLFQNQSK